MARCDRVDHRPYSPFDLSLTYHSVSHVSTLLDGVCPACDIASCAAATAAAAAAERAERRCVEDEVRARDRADAFEGLDAMGRGHSQSEGDNQFGGGASNFETELHPYVKSSFYYHNMEGKASSRIDAPGDPRRRIGCTGSPSLHVLRVQSRLMPNVLIFPRRFVLRRGNAPTPLLAGVGEVDADTRAAALAAAAAAEDAYALDALPRAPPTSHQMAAMMGPARQKGPGWGCGNRELASTTTAYHCICA